MLLFLFLLVGERVGFVLLYWIIVFAFLGSVTSVPVVVKLGKKGTKPSQILKIILFYTYQVPISFSTATTLFI